MADHNDPNHSSEDPSEDTIQYKYDQYAEIVKEMYADQNLSKFKPPITKGGKFGKTNKSERDQQTARLNELLEKRIDYAVSILPGVSRSLETMLKTAIRYYPKKGNGNKMDKTAGVEISQEIRKLKDACDYLGTEIAELEEEFEDDGNNEKLEEQIKEKRDTVKLFEQKIEECIKKSDGNIKMNFNDAAGSILRILSKGDNKSRHLFNKIRETLCPNYKMDEPKDTRETKRNTEGEWKTVEKRDSKVTYNAGTKGKYVPSHMREPTATISTKYNRTSTFEPRKMENMKGKYIPPSMRAAVDKDAHVSPKVANLSEFPTLSTEKNKNTSDNQKMSFKDILLMPEKVTTVDDTQKKKVALEHIKQNTLKDSWEDESDEEIDNVEELDNSTDGEDVVLDDTDINQHIEIKPSSVTLSSDKTNLKLNADGTISSLMWSSQTTTTTWKSKYDDDEW